MERSGRAEPELVFLPLGGVGEIGMNLALYGFGTPKGRKWIMVDCGVNFGDESVPGVDLLLPDISFIEAERQNLLGILLTHAHEDHYGALIDLWPRLKVPVYATPFTAGMLMAKCAGEPGAPKIPVNVVPQGGRVTLGPFEVEYVAMSHSIPEPNALAIRTAAGLVVHSGDWKVDPAPGVGLPIDLARLKALGDEGVRAFMCDSTNVLSPGRSPSEASVAEGLTRVIARAKYRVAVTTFASNVARIRAVAKAAAANDRQVVVMGRSLWRVIEVGRELGMFDDVPDFLDQESYGYLPRDKVVALMTGSQGEPRAALARIASGDHRDVALSPGDLVVFSARAIPGNERAIGEVMNALARDGVEILTDRDALIHASGHPRQDELADLYELLRPQVLIPVHGEPMHLAAHGRFARRQGIRRTLVIGNGQMVRLGPGEADVIDAMEPGQLYKDGRLVVEPEKSGAQDRRRASFAGVVVVSLVLARDGSTPAEPEVAVIGLPDEDGRGNSMADVVKTAAAGVLTSIPRTRRRDPALVAEAVRRASRAAVAEVWGKKPLCRVLTTVV